MRSLVSRPFVFKLGSCTTYRRRVLENCHPSCDRLQLHRTTPRNAPRATEAVREIYAYTHVEQCSLIDIFVGRVIYRRRGKQGATDPSADTVTLYRTALQFSSALSSTPAPSPWVDDTLLAAAERSLSLAFFVGPRRRG